VPARSTGLTCTESAMRTARTMGAGQHLQAPSVVQRNRQPTEADHREASLLSFMFGAWPQEYVAFWRMNGSPARSGCLALR
jgi:hypothetical protein